MIGGLMMITDERQNEILGLISELSDHFNIRPPRVDFKRHLPYGWMACYSQWERLITLSEKAANSETWESVVCHEFAHHLQRQREVLELEVTQSQQRIRQLKAQVKKDRAMLSRWDFGYRESQKESVSKRRSKREKKSRRRHHDELFARCLWRVIEHHFGSVDRYKAFEYKGVRQLIETMDALKALKKTT